jgi:hypothetical protein
VHAVAPEEDSPGFVRRCCLSRYEKQDFLQRAGLKKAAFEKNANYLQAALKVFQTLADNLINGGLLSASAGKSNVTAS